VEIEISGTLHPFCHRQLHPTRDPTRVAIHTSCHVRLAWRATARVPRGTPGLTQRAHSAKPGHTRRLCCVHGQPRSRLLRGDRPTDNFPTRPMANEIGVSDKRGSIEDVRRRRRETSKTSSTNRAPMSASRSASLNLHGGRIMVCPRKCVWLLDCYVFHGIVWQSTSHLCIP
jgi:hypothetical protein